MVPLGSPTWMPNKSTAGLPQALHCCRKTAAAAGRAASPGCCDRMGLVHGRRKSIFTGDKSYVENQILAEGSSRQGKAGVQSKSGNMSFSGPAHSKPNHPCFHRPERSPGTQCKLPLAEEETKDPTSPGHLRVAI